MDRKIKCRDEQMLIDYSELISKFSLLNIAGMSINHALHKIADDYTISLSNTSEHHYAYDELVITCKQLKNGVYETAAYDEFGRRCKLPCYIKFSSYLCSGLKHGTSDFYRLLSEEAANALLERKSTILQRGERASSKLMAPMMLIFVVILILVMVPAFLSMTI